MMGPASGGLQAFTLRRKLRKGVGYSGTPWSGQAVNWNWRTSLLSLLPLWHETQLGKLTLLSQVISVWTLPWVSQHCCIAEKTISYAVFFSQGCEKILNRFMQWHSKEWKWNPVHCIYPNNTFILLKMSFKKIKQFNMSPNGPST